MKKEQSVIIWILAALMVYNLFLNTKIRTNIQEYEDKIDNLQTKVDAVNLVNRQIDGKINSLHSQIEVIDSDISNVQASIKKIKQKTNEKVNSVDQFSFTDLEQFFSVRYQNRLDSIPTGTGSQISN
jgi:peptidoglycan hydrolase CwlO-like protein